MSNLALEHRPQAFDQVIGQDLVVTQVLNHLHNIMGAPNESAQPVLLVGKHGTGKTTIGRLIAKYLNCQTPSKNLCECPNCIAVSKGTFVDFIELDAASNNGVDDVRRLNELAYTKPLNKFKVMLIDEAHKLSNAACNALLKSLEEPPPGVLYVLATTEVNKIIPTILSRCFQATLKPVPPEKLAKYLKSFNTDYQGPDEGFNVIANKANGSVRDAIKYFTGALNAHAKTILDVEEALGVSGIDEYKNLIKAILDKNIEKAFSVFYSMEKKGTTSTEVFNTLNAICADLLLTASGFVQGVQFAPDTYYVKHFQNISVYEANNLVKCLLEVQGLNFGVITKNHILHAITNYYLSHSDQSTNISIGNNLPVRPSTLDKQFDAITSDRPKQEISVDEIVPPKTAKPSSTSTGNAFIDKLTSAAKNLKPPEKPVEPTVQDDEDWF